MNWPPFYLYLGPVRICLSRRIKDRRVRVVAPFGLTGWCWGWS